jgi:hypothetical protein
MAHYIDSLRLSKPLEKDSAQPEKTEQKTILFSDTETTKYLP